MEPAEFIAFDLPSDSESDGEPFKKPEFVSISVLTPLPIPPWTDDPSKYPHEASHLLHQEILDYLKYVKPTDIEKSLREATLTNLKASILRILPNAKVNVFGSFATGLYLPSSDMDIVVSDRSICLPKILYELRTQFYKDNIAKSVEVIESAKIPIIKFVDENTGFKVDISFNMENGVIAAAMVNSFLSDPVHGRTVKALMLVLKQFLVQRYLFAISNLETRFSPAG